MLLDIDQKISGLSESMEHDKMEALEEMVADTPSSQPCPHGNAIEDCNACMVDGDLAVTAALERR